MPSLARDGFIYHAASICRANRAGMPVYYFSEAAGIMCGVDLNQIPQDGKVSHYEMLRYIDITIAVTAAGDPADVWILSCSAGE